MKSRLLLLLLLLVPVLGDSAPRRERRLLVPVVFYPGHVIGGKNRPAGILSSADRGATWDSIAWEDLIASALSVDASGRWIFAACGNGVLVSSDAGAHWRLTGGWELNECSRVAIDRRDPRRAWVSTSYGIYRTADALHWTQERVGIRPRYASDVIQDAVEPRRIWAGTEEGVFVSEDEGVSFRPSSPPAAVRRLLQDGRDPRILRAGTEKQGMLETLDGGRTWSAVPGAPASCESMVQDASRLLCGTKGGVSVLEDGNWTSHALPLSEARVTDLALDGERVWAATSEGLFRSRDRGETWEKAGLDGAVLNGVWVGELAAGLSEPLPSVAEPFRVPRGPRREECRSEDPAFRLRQKQYMTRMCGSGWDPAKGLPDFFQSIAFVHEGKDTPEFWEAMEKRFTPPGRGMFFTMLALSFFLHVQDRAPASLAEKVRWAMVENPAYRGDTENHWVMHYAVQLLSAQRWPDTPPSRWYTGRTSREMYEEAKGWLMHWARLTATRGQGEFDSPGYLFMFVAPVALLYDFAEDPEVHQMAGMMLDLLLADYLSESLGGAYCGAHSRVDEGNLVAGALNTPTGYHFLCAGGVTIPKNLHSYITNLAASSWSPPSMFRAMANRRDRPFVMTEVKRLRNCIRHAPVLNPPAFKYNWMTPSWCLGSARGGILQPIQQHTWDVTWRSAGRNPTLFTVQPHASGRELAQFFSGDEETLYRVVSVSKKYDDPDKWVSSSPYERILQRENVLLALYQVPEGERFPEVSLYWPSCLERKDEGGWMTGRDGDFRVSVFPCQEGTWTVAGDHARFRCKAGRAGFAVVVGEESKGPPVLSGEGESLSLSLGDLRLEWGRSAPFPSEWLCRGPYLNARFDEGVVEMTDGMRTRRLDFNRMEVTEREGATGRGGGGAWWLGIPLAALFACCALRRTVRR